MACLTKYFFCCKKNLPLWIFFLKTTTNFLKMTRSTNQAVKINVEMSKTQQYDQTWVDQTNVPKSKGVPKKLQKNAFSGIIFGKVAGLVPQLCLQKTTW